MISIRYAVFLLAVFLPSTQILASGAVERQRQMKAMQQGGMQEAYAQQIIEQQRQQAMQAAAQEMIAQMQQQQVAQYVQAVQQKQAYEYAQAVAQQQAVQYIKTLQEKQIADYMQAVQQRQAVEYIQALQQRQMAEYIQGVQQQQIAGYIQAAQAQQVTEAVASLQQRQAAEYMQALQQRQAAEYMQAMLERQAQEYAQAVAHQQAQLQVQIKAAGQQQAAKLGVQEQAMVQALAEQYKQMVLAETIRQKMTLDAAQMAQLERMTQAKAQADVLEQMRAKNAAQTAADGREIAQNRPYEPVSKDEVKDIVDITDVWRKLDVDSRSWTLLIDNQAKAATINEFRERFRKQGIIIKQDPLQYAQMIDDVAAQNPSLMLRPFKDVLQIMAVMQYDFDNGMDRDMLARKMLGEALYQSNKKRLGR